MNTSGRLWSSILKTDMWGVCLMWAPCGIWAVCTRASAAVEVTQDGTATQPPEKKQRTRKEWQRKSKKRKSKKGRKDSRKRNGCTIYSRTWLSPSTPLGAVQNQEQQQHTWEQAWPAQEWPVQSNIHAGWLGLGRVTKQSEASDKNDPAEECRENKVFPSKQKYQN